MPLSAFTTTQAYRLEIQQQPPALFSVFAFEAEEALNAPYWVEIQATCPLPHLAMDDILGRSACFSIQPVIAGLPAWNTLQRPEPRFFHGVITQFKKLRSNHEETLYSLRLEPRMAAALRPTQASRIIQNSSIPKIIEALLRQTAGGPDSGALALANGGLGGNDFTFKLNRTYLPQEYTTQFNESDLTFLHRLAEEAGIYYYFTQTDEHEILTFGDDLEHYLRQQLSTVLHGSAGLNSSAAESLQSLSTHYQQVPQTIRLNDYNYRRQGDSLQVSAGSTGRELQGRIDDYGAHYKTEEEGRQIAQLRHEERLAEQIVYHGSGNVRLLSAGTVFTLNNTLLPEAEFGLLVTTIRHSAARDQAYQNRFTAIPSHRIFRPKRLTPWPRITGTLPARIATPNYKDAFLDEMGRYVVAFDFDRDEWSPGSNSRRVRLAKPFAGGNETGFHFPLLEGTEVAIAFTGGHPDRPYIAHAMHDSGHPDHVSQSNHTRNIIRTQSNNKLRMEDKSKQEHIKLSTEFGGKSQLNLGHLVDAQRAKRGEGFELRSDSHGAIRAGKGLFVSADAQNAAGGQQLDMQAAISQLEQAIQIAKSLNEVAGIAQADAADTDGQAALKEVLNGLKEAGLLLSAPAGIALTSPEQIQLATAASLNINAGQDASLSLMKRLTVAAGEAISLFAQKSGIKLFAARGKVDIQAQNNALNLAAQQDVSISSSQGKVVVNAKEEILLTSGGGYIRLKDGNIELGCPGDVTIKAVAMVKRGPDKMTVHHPAFPQSILKQKLLFDFKHAPDSVNTGLAGMPFTLFADGAEIKKGVLDTTGQLVIDHEIVTENYIIELANGVVYQVPVPIDYRNPEQAILANKGFQNHESKTDSEVNQPSHHSEHRKTYFDLVKGLAERSHS